MRIGRKNRISKTRLNSINMNNMAFNFYCDTLYQIACSVFNWSGLPSTVDKNYMEQVLLERGKVLIFYDEVVKAWVALPFTYNGRFNLYGYPNRRYTYSQWSTYKKRCTPENSVIIFDNKLRTNVMMDTISYYAHRLYNLDRVIDINCNAQKTPVLLTGTKNMMLSVKNAYQQFDGNMPVLATGKKFDPESIKSLSTGAPFIAPEMAEMRATIWNDFLTAIGVPNLSINKKERLIKDEVVRSAGGTIACRYPRLEARERGCELLNGLKLWHDTVGTDVKVNYREGSGGETNVYNVVGGDSEGSQPERTAE